MLFESERQAVEIAPGLFCGDIELEQRRQLCLEVAINEHLVPKSPDRSIANINFINRMEEYMFQNKDNEVIVHSWDDSFTFRDVSAKTIYEHVVGRMRLNGFLLHEREGSKHLTVHVWGDDDTVAFALARTNPQYDRVLMTVSYTDSADNHIDLVHWTILDYINYNEMLNDGKRLTGFSSYDIHNLDSYCSKVGVDSFVSHDGMFPATHIGYPDLTGIEALGATDENFELLQLVYGTY